jgi:hypothetical protein
MAFGTSIIGSETDSCILRILYLFGEREGERSAHGAASVHDSLVYAQQHSVYGDYWTAFVRLRHRCKIGMYESHMGLLKKAFVIK